jgi:demethylsterigmatocystin 6-O-methyltransferase
VQKAFGYVDTDLIGILTEKPEAGQGFGMLMSTWGEGHALLQHLYPVEPKLVAPFDEKISPVTFVDVGGGYGQKAIALKDEFPQLPGRIIVQDLPMSIDRAPKVDGIEFQAHNFFTPQPIKGE